MQSPSPSCVGLLFVSPTDGCSAKYKTGPAGLVGRKARTPRRIICCRIRPRLASPDASKHVATNATTAIKLTTCQTRFLASLAIAGIRLIRQNWRQRFRCRWSLRMNRPELDVISFSLHSGDIDRPRKQHFMHCSGPTRRCSIKLIHGAAQISSRCEVKMMTQIG